MKRINPLMLCDYYKVSHVAQYPKGTSLVYTNFTPRKSRIPGINKVVVFDIQYFIEEYLIDYFNKEFFEKPLKEILEDYQEEMRSGLGKDLPSYDHIAKLHALGYMPLEIKALPEGLIMGLLKSI